MSLFSDRIRYAREKKNLSQKEVAEELSMTQQGYSNIETGRREPNLETLRKLRHILGESLDFFIGYDIEDDLGNELYEIYAEARRLRIEAEEDLQYTIEHPDKNLDQQIKILRQYKDELKAAEIKEEKAFNIFYDHVIKIPGYEEYELDKQYWIDIYDSYQEKDRNIAQAFWEKFNSI